MSVFPPSMLQWFQTIFGNDSYSYRDRDIKTVIQEDTNSKAKQIPKGFILLNGCTTIEQHNERVLADLYSAGIQHEAATNINLGKRLRGKEGLRAVGFEFRFVPCKACSSSKAQDETNPLPDDRAGWHSCKDCATRLCYVGKEVANSTDHIDCNNSNKGPYCGQEGDDGQRNETVIYCENEPSKKQMNGGEIQLHDNNCDNCLAPSDTSAEPVLITSQNRKLYIADGSHYELLCTLSQEAAHDAMCQTFNLHWVTVCDDEQYHEHVRALVDEDHPLAIEEKDVLEQLLGVHHVDIPEAEKEGNKGFKFEQSSSQCNQKSVLLIATGRGKVRAGVFSRLHLLTAGIEVGTAWHNIREARNRNMGVVIIDPNARGEQEGMETFKKSVIRLFARAASRVRHSLQHEEHRDSYMQHSTRHEHVTSIYILAHSASGGQLVRHLREDPSLLPTIKAIAFTDSTHNVQWCKGNSSLMQFLSAQNCVYLRSNDVRASQSCINVSSRGKDIACPCINCVDNRKNAGLVADTDSFWEHRFGKIRTLWAGTADHALSNWAAHDSIWLHFDSHCKSERDRINVQNVDTSYK